MKKLYKQILALPALACFALSSVAVAQINQAQYFGAGQPTDGSVPMMAAAPLAGGPSAARGSEFVDAHGKPIVLQTNYAQGCPTGDCYGGDFYGGDCYGGDCYGACPAGAGAGMGDGVYADFGGYGQDQIGPHYFDVSVDAVFLRADELLQGAPAITAVGIGVNSPRINSLDAMSTDYEPGWRISGRLDLGPLSVFEATYMGLTDIDVNNRVVSSVVTEQLLGVSTPNFLFTPASADASAVLIPALDAAEVHDLNFQSELHSSELTYRRYWVGHNPRFSGTYLLGARYVRNTQDFTFAASGGTAGGAVNWNSENDLVGAQFGGDMWIGLRQGLRFGLEGKSGIYNNRFKFSNTNTFGAGSAASEGNQIAYIGEFGAQMVADIWPSVSLKGGYQVLYMNSLVNVANNIDGVDFVTNAVNTQGDALYHGFNAGLEYIW
ncbi:MAG: hypothetical protein RH917_13565 [Lacipirellulaceae bacterium]